MTSLSDYEAQIVRNIAAWKAEKISLYGRIANGATKPIANIFGRMIPNSVGVHGISAAYAATGWMTGADEILKRSGVASLDELHAKPLQFCDQMAGQIDRGSQAFAAVDGAITGAGGFLLAAADVVALTMIVLRAIRQTGHCYGFSLDRPQDRPYVLGILMVACTRSPAERLELYGKLADIEKWWMNQAVEATLIEGLSRQLLKLASLEAIPGIGAVLGSTANLAFCRHVTRAARCIFQERWLTERNKIPGRNPE